MTQRRSLSRPLPGHPIPSIAQKLSGPVIALLPQIWKIIPMHLKHLLLGREMLPLQRVRNNRCGKALTPIRLIPPAGMG